MIKLSYGTQKQVSFANFNEYYFALGFLANSNNAELRWENNEEQGAWGSEGRIHCLVPETRFPQFFRFTAGRGNVYARINCNEYVATLVRDHNFKYNSKRQDLEEIIKTVPPEYRQSFQEGYGRQVKFNPAYQKNKDINQSSGLSSNETNPSTPSVKTQPKPELIDICVGETVEHKIFGTGTVYEVDGIWVRVEFAKGVKKPFANPQSFSSGFLKKISI